MLQELVVLSAVAATIVGAADFSGALKSRSAKINDSKIAHDISGYHETSTSTSGSKITRECIGMGSDGLVWLVRVVKEGAEKKIAEKRVSISSVVTTATSDSLLMELSAMKAMSNDSLFPTLYGYHVDGDDVCIQMEFLEGKTLSELLEYTSLDDAFVKYLGKCLLQAIDSMAKRGWVHCDLSGRNIMITTSGDVKVIDFGRAVKDGGTHSLLASTTLKTWAPEVRKSVMTTKSDIWSWGVVIFKATTGELPFTDVDSEVLSPAVSRVQDDLWSLLKLAFARDPQFRPTAESFLRAPYFATASKDDFSAYFERLKAFLCIENKAIPKILINEMHEEIEEYKQWARPTDIEDMKRKLLKLKEDVAPQ